MRCAFLSDIHYRKGETEGEKLFLKFLYKKAHHFDRIYILGDLFEFYLGYPHFFYKEHRKVISYLKLLSLWETKIYMIEGNHEYGFTEAGKFLNMKVYRKNCIAHIDGRYVYLEHGDLINKKDWRHILCQYILKSPAMLYVFKKIYPSVMMKLSHIAGNVSKNYLRAKNGAIEKMFADYALKIIEEKDMDVVILAHIHQPLYLKKGKKIYINSGDFLEHYTFVVYENGNFYLDRMK
ncbi:MAG: metallophosphoesterase [Deltaproteobacteria bacterium]|nr:metallophosphoesterase [Deltaproteobacteria bacterium]